MGVPGVPWHTQILADQLTLFQPGGTDYAHLITTGTPGFSDLPTALTSTLPITTLSQSRGTDYAHLITTGTSGFSDLPTALHRAEILTISCSYFGRNDDFINSF